MHRQILGLWGVLKHPGAAGKSRVTGESLPKLLGSLLEKVVLVLVAPKHVSVPYVQCWLSVFVCDLCWWGWAHVTEVLPFWQLERYKSF